MRLATPAQVLRQFARHCLLAVQLFTRIPVTGRLAHWVGYSPALLQASAAHLPGVGWLVGAAGAAVLGLGLQLWALPGATGVAALAAEAAEAAAGPALSGPGVWVAVLLSMAATAWLTGAFHEDGLADTADALGGHVPRERALEIMKDSRIGSYGTVTLVLALALKAALLAAIVSQHGTAAAMAAVWTAHVLSRFAPLLVMARLPYAGDAARSKSSPLAAALAPDALWVGAAWCMAALSLLGLLGFLGFFTPLRHVFIGVYAIKIIVSLLAASIAVWVMTRWLRRRLQGFTGDTLGAAQQVVELALYLGLALSPQALWGILGLWGGR